MVRVMVGIGPLLTMPSGVETRTVCQQCGIQQSTHLYNIEWLYADNLNNYN